MKLNKLTNHKKNCIISLGINFICCFPFVLMLNVQMMLILLFDFLLSRAFRNCIFFLLSVPLFLHLTSNNNEIELSNHFIKLFSNINRHLCIVLISFVLIIDSSLYFDQNIDAAEGIGMPSFSFIDKEYSLILRDNAMFRAHSENNDD